MKKFILLACIASILCGCSFNNKIGNSLEIRQESEDPKVSFSMADSEIYSYGQFSQGYAWLNWKTSGGNQKASLINKKGQLTNLKDPNGFLGNKSKKVIGIPIDISTEAVRTIGFYEGYAWCKTNGDYYIINTDLEILRKISSSENKEIKAVGGKYYMALVTEEDFDHREQYLAIYDYNDKLIVQTEDCDPKSSYFLYLGNGIFCFVNSKDKAFLLTTSGVLKEFPRKFQSSIGNQNLRFKEGATQLLLTCDNPEGDTICILDNDGTFQSVSLKDCYGIPGINSKGLVLYYSGSFGNLTAISKDITKQNEVYKLNENLSKRLVYSTGMSETRPIFHFYLGVEYQFNENGIGALSFKGADEKHYIGIFDSKFNQIGDMIQGAATRCYFEDGLMVVYLLDGTVAAYNEKGEKKFEFPKGTIYVSPPSDGVFAVILDGDLLSIDLLEHPKEQYLYDSNVTASPSEVCYITTDGKRLFKEITQS